MTLYKVKWLIFKLAVIFLVPLASCNDTTKPVEVTVPQKNVKQPTIEPAILFDSTDAYKVAGKWIKPKKDFEFNDSARISGDTLYLVTCADFVYYPFGDIKDKYKLKESLLNNFKVYEKAVRTDDGNELIYQILRKENNKLLLFWNEESNSDSYWGSYIREGKIIDSSVDFARDIKIGMTTDRFYSMFFEYFDESIKRKIKFIVFEPCISGNPNHIYSFSNGKLAVVQFECVNCGGKTIDY